MQSRAHSFIKDIALRHCRRLVLVALCCMPLFAGAEQNQGTGADAKNAGPAKQGLFEIATVGLRAAHGRSGAVTLDIAIDDKAAIGMENTPYWVLFAAGAAAVPMAVINPFYGLGVFYPIIGTPMNAVFNARRDTLASAVKAEPLPERMLAILTELLDTDPVPVPANVAIRISSYGLVPKSGKAANVLGLGDELCLAAHAQLSIARDGAPPVESTIVVGLEGQDEQAPPPVCASIGQFAKEDGAYLRQAILEMAEVLSAIVVHRLRQTSRQPS